MIEERLYDFAEVLNQIDFSAKFQGSNVRELDLERWYFDTDHGLLHSLLVSFFAYERISSEHKELDKIMASCLLHDFVKSTDDETNHDQRLKEYFPDLAPDVYTHANPPEETPLVIGDRIELRRYYDWESWVNVDIKEYTQENEVAHFYNNTRDSLTRDSKVVKCMENIYQALLTSNMV